MRKPQKSYIPSNLLPVVTNSSKVHSYHRLIQFLRVSCSSKHVIRLGSPKILKSSGFLQYLSWHTTVKFVSLSIPSVPGKLYYFCLQNDFLSQSSLMHHRLCCFSLITSPTWIISFVYPILTELSPSNRTYLAKKRYYCRLMSRHSLSLLTQSQTR